MVTSYVQLLARRYADKLDSDADEFIACAVEGATRMRTLIDALLEYSRVGGREREFLPTDFETVLDEVLANLQATIDETAAVVTRDPLPTVAADEAQIARLFQNLIGNAIKFRGDDPPRVHVSAKKDGREAIFSVRDNGIGIAKQHLDRLTERFYRVDVGRSRDSGGTGLGLAIVKHILNRHQAELHIESTPGEGSLFQVSFPAARTRKANADNGDITATG